VYDRVVEIVSAVYVVKQEAYDSDLLLRLINYGKIDVVVALRSFS